MPYAAIILFALLVLLTIRAMGNSSNPTQNSSIMYGPIDTQLLMRNDSEGLGHFGAPRGSRKHMGLDILATAGQKVYAPISGSTRVFQAYSNRTDMVGVEINNALYKVKLMYCAPVGSLPKIVSSGDLIGMVQNVSGIYNRNMKNHLHIETYVRGSVVNPNQFFKVTA